MGIVVFQALSDVSLIQGATSKIKENAEVKNIFKKSAKLCENLDLGKLMEEAS